NLTSQVRNIAQVTTAVANGDLSWKITVDARGEISELKNTVNRMVDQLNGFASEVTRVAREVGTEGKLGGQAYVPGVAGTWKDLTDSVNYMASNLTNQVRNIAQVTTAVANGDLSRKITVDVQGEILELKNTINTMVDQLNSFASEVTRVAREVGTEGKLGGQAEARGVAGTWKDLTENVNSMAANLTTQVRGIAKVVTGVANGDLKRKLVLETKGEIAELAYTINGMIDTLATFADQVTTVAREVGVEGKLGGQARVPGAAGIWRDLTDNVNQLAANLTNQVRAIADVANAVTSGDLTRTISVEAKGEVAALKDNINEMIRTLARTTRQNQNQDWLKTNIAKFTGMLQGQRDLVTVAKLLLSELSPLVQAQCGTVYVAEEENTLKLLAAYALGNGNAPERVQAGEGIVGQCALEKRRMLITNVPRDYTKISSSLGEATAASIVVLPVLFEGEAKAVIELASLAMFNDIHLALLDQITQSLGIVLNTIAATMRTEELLKQSQALAEQLQTTNAELKEKAHLLAEQKTEVEATNREVEQARAALEEKAEQLATTSKYKSEFLANMSHELRTPLNNVLLLAQTLSSNADKNLTPRQVKYAETIHSSGTDLLALINDILDLSKIESGKIDVEIREVLFAEVRDYCARTFKHVADGKGLDFVIDVDRNLHNEASRTDPKRLQQILKNLLSNALKFTERGTVKLRIARAASGWSPEHPVLNRTKSVIAYSVSDTGIGIPQSKQILIFEAFQQSDGTTSRKYGGTGLGLSISREIARLLGGEIRLNSQLDVGSTFTLYLPQMYVAAPTIVKPDLQRVTPIGEEGPALNGHESTERALRSAPVTALEEEIVEDDRTAISPGDPVLLIVESDIIFAHILKDLAHERDLKALIALEGSRGLALAREFRPGAITLNIGLPDMSGWTLLDRFKHDSETRHIPVHVISADENRPLAFALGAMTYVEKPVTRESLSLAFTAIECSVRSEIKKLVLARPDKARIANLHSVLKGPGIEVIELETAAEVLEAIRNTRVDCIAVDLRISDISSPELIEHVQRATGARTPPLLLYGSRELTERETSEIRRLSRFSFIRHVQSPPELLYETVLLLHRAEVGLTNEQRKMLEEVLSKEEGLAGKTVLVVDDDIRTIFALTSILEQHNMSVLHAEDGRSGINLLRKTPAVDLVLMDIMMPEMDGYQTMHAIRLIPELKHLPIIALTANAMKGDRQKCIVAGAWDYIAKPVDVSQLFSLMRVCLARAYEAQKIACEAEA
ncbi:MAG: response regulator, partial [Chloroflexi bacterium]